MATPYPCSLGPDDSCSRWSHRRRQRVARQRPEVKVLKWQPWIGIRVNNALKSFLSTDVKSNISSPAFGTFYSSDYRQFRLQVRFER
jgi:hypothetical protein